MAWRWVPEREPEESLPARTFASQGEAETWLGEFYPELLAAGVQEVSLYEEDRRVYGPMNLAPDITE
jgi:hypothetical protein